TALFYPAPQGSDDRDGKVATALEELEKQRAEAASRAAEPDRIAALSARIDALEQKLAAAPQPAEGDDRLKAIEQKLAELAKQRGAPAGQQADSRSNSESIAAINRKLEALEQRVASLAPRSAGASAPAATSAPAASRAPAPVPPRPQPYPRPGYGPEDDGVAMLPPAAVPEPPGAAPAVPVRGWVLHNVTGGVAVLEGRGSGLVEARRGQYVRGLGRILGISRRGDLWVVTTESGVITAPVY
ncbi:hypothetical protein ACFOEX_03070, partial [Camelimonas abortus]